MTNELTITSSALAQTYSIAEAGQAANTAASKATFQRELAEVSDNTRVSYQTDLATWGAYLEAARVDLVGCDFYNSPFCWRDVTYGLVLGFKEWMLGQGFAIASVNRKLSCVRRFCKMATTAGELPSDELTKIQTIRTIKRGKGIELDQHRSNKRIDRPEAKKAAALLLDAEQVKLIKQQPDTPQGRRDALLICLLLEHGLRAGEVSALTVTDFNLKTGKFSFWREKVKKSQTHKLTADTLRALRAYIDNGDAPALGLLLRGSRKGGELDKPGMSTVSISDRVRTLGAAIGVPGLSAHDCRHTWATHAVASGTDAFGLKEAGGWSSIATVGRYVEAAKIANEGVKLPY